MKNIVIATEKKAENSLVRCTEGVLERELPEAIKSFRGALIFTDENVYRIYGDKLKAYLPTVSVYIMSAGEAHKTQETLFALLAAMATADLHRGSVLVALGGGVVGDIGGLAASLYMRGISCIQVPTSLLSQVDSSVGGKTAIDFCGVKNLIGSFKQPELVLADPTFFATLPLREIRCGLGEIIKHGALDGELFEILTENEERLFDLEFLAAIVPKNIAYKASIVQRDPHEKGVRKCLNLGHTTGHAIELSEGNLSHGECVLCGMIYEAEIARRCLQCDAVYLDCLIALCRKVLGISLAAIDIRSAAKLAKLDKKNFSGEQVVLTVPVRKGEHALLDLPYREYEDMLSEIKEGLC